MYKVYIEGDGTNEFKGGVYVYGSLVEALKCCFAVKKSKCNRYICIKNDYGEIFSINKYGHSYIDRDKVILNDELYIIEAFLGI